MENSGATRDPVAIVVLMCRRSLAIAVLALATWASFEAWAQQPALQPRAVPQKPTLKELQSIAASNEVIVKFREGSGIRYRGGQLASQATEDTAAFEFALRQLGISPTVMQRVFERPEAELDREREQGQRRSGKVLADLNLYYVIPLPARASAADVAHALNALAIVEHAEPARQPAPPPADIPPTTPDFTAQQTYKNAPPGIGTVSPNLIPGADGSLTDYADVEYMWQLDHEDIELDSSSRQRTPVGCIPADINPPAGTDHGTAVLGVISGKDNGYGITGIAPAARAYVVPTNCTAASGIFPAWSVARAINRAVALGGVTHILIEQQAGSACGGTATMFGPVEETQLDYDTIASATANGVVVVEAAGNGSLDLDSAACNNRYDRNNRDSGAIMVGAGSSNAHDRLASSNFGARVDVQGWGQGVVTTGYGGLFMGDPANPDIRQRYTSTFNGTSSASAVVMGAVLAIQGARLNCNQPLLTSEEMRGLLASTGTPQGTGTAGNIGPLPNIRAAIAARSEMRSCRPVMQVSGGDFSFSGLRGRPFGGAPRTISSTTNSLTFSITNLPPWLSVSPAAGGAGVAGTTVVFSPNSFAQGLPVGTYGPVAISFSNVTNFLGDTTRNATLTVHAEN